MNHQVICKMLHIHDHQLFKCKADEGRDIYLFCSMMYPICTQRMPMTICELTNLLLQPCRGSSTSQILRSRDVTLRRRVGVCLSLTRSDLKTNTFSHYALFSCLFWYVQPHLPPKSNLVSVSPSQDGGRGLIWLFCAFSFIRKQSLGSPIIMWSH